jgi:hypothetical protein
MKAAFALKMMKAARIMKDRKAKKDSRTLGTQSGGGLSLVVRVEAVGHAMGLLSPASAALPLNQLGALGEEEGRAHIAHRVQMSHCFLHGVSSFEREYWASFDSLPPSSTATIPHFDRYT